MPARTTRKTAQAAPQRVGSTLLKFVEAPPPAVRGIGADSDAWKDEAEELRSHKGQWAILKTYPKGPKAGALAQSVKAGKLAAFRPAGSFEAVARTVDNEGHVYARYVG
jgi:hypothetical protein